MSESGGVRKTAREIGVIVIGVLLALGADALYGRWIERGRLQTYRVGLAEDLQADSTELSRLLGTSVRPGLLRAQKSAVDTLMLLLDSPSLVLPDATVSRLLRDSQGIPGGSKARATFDEIVSAGDLNLFGPSDLRRELVGYYAVPLLENEGVYEAWLTSTYYPYVQELNSVFGAGRVSNEWWECEDTECFESIDQGDELDLFRGASQLEGLIGGMDLLEHFVLVPAGRQQKTVHRLLGGLR